jgi:hypothetical protein
MKVSSHNYHLRDAVMGPIFAAEPDRADIVLPAAEVMLWKAEGATGFTVLAYDSARSMTSPRTDTECRPAGVGKFLQFRPGLVIRFPISSL